MFVPSESIFADIHERFEDIVQKAHRARIVIVSPSLLMLSIQVVTSLLRDQRMREQAHVIQQEVGRLMEDVGRLDERVKKLQLHFGQANKDVEDILVSTRKISGRGERIEAVEARRGRSRRRRAHAAARRPARPVALAVPQIEAERRTTCALPYTRVRGVSRVQKPRPPFRNSSSSGVDSRPSIALRWGKRPNLRMMSRCLVAKSSLARAGAFELPAATQLRPAKSQTERS